MEFWPCRYREVTAKIDQILLLSLSYFKCVLLICIVICCAKNEIKLCFKDLAPEGAILVPLFIPVNDPNGAM